MFSAVLNFKIFLSSGEMGLKKGLRELLEHLQSGEGEFDMKKLKEEAMRELALLFFEISKNQEDDPECVEASRYHLELAVCHFLREFAVSFYFFLKEDE